MTCLLTLNASGTRSRHPRRLRTFDCYYPHMSVPTDTRLAELVQALARQSVDSGRTVVAAESCTGGWIAKACTDLPGSSRWFLGSVVAYANEIKTAFLGVDPDTLAGNGAVSEAVVREMVLGALERLGGDLGVA